MQQPTAEAGGTVVPEPLLSKMRQAGFSFNDQERVKYIKTVEPLGQGSYGKVREAYRQPSAEDATTPLPLSNGYVRVAIKEIDLMRLKDEAKRLRVVSGAIREARLLRRVRGAAHLIQSFRPWYNARRGRLCFPMEMADMDLLSYMRQTKYNPPAGYLLSLAKQMLLALQELHERRIVHRDVKLENFLVFTSDHQGQPPTIKLADFGLSATEEEAESSVHERVGTPYFMAPECYRPGCCHSRQPSLASTTASSISSSSLDCLYARDVWGLGCVLFIMVNGVLPFRWDSKKEPLECVLAGRRHLPSIPRWAGPEREVLHQLALRCLEVDLNLRPTVSQLLQELHGKVKLLRLSPLNRELLTVWEKADRRRMSNSDAPPKVYQLMRVCRPDYSIFVYSAYPIGESRAVPAPIHSISCGEVLLLESELALPVSLSSGCGCGCSLPTGEWRSREDGEASNKMMISPTGAGATTKGTCLTHASAEPPLMTPTSIGWANESVTDSSSGTQRWAKIVYPVRGFCRSEENGHHVFHPYHHSEETCPRLGCSASGKQLSACGEGGSESPSERETNNSFSLSHSAASPPALCSAALHADPAVGARPSIMRPAAGEAVRRRLVAVEEVRFTDRNASSNSSSGGIWDRLISIVVPRPFLGTAAGSAPTPTEAQVNGRINL